MCLLCEDARCQAETVNDDGWRLCALHGFAYLVKDGQIGVVLETQRIRPTRENPDAGLPLLAQRVVWK